MLKRKSFSIDCNGSGADRDFELAWTWFWQRLCLKHFFCTWSRNSSSFLYSTSFFSHQTFTFVSLYQNFVGFSALCSPFCYFWFQVWWWFQLMRTFGAVQHARTWTPSLQMVTVVFVVRSEHFFGQNLGNCHYFSFLWSNYKTFVLWRNWYYLLDSVTMIG